MKYEITRSYNWYETPEETFLVKMYSINGVAFTFDELNEKEKEDPEIVKIANKTRTYSAEQLFYQSFYLIDEQCHPCLFDLELENPEILDEIA